MKRFTSMILAISLFFVGGVCKSVAQTETADKTELEIVSGFTGLSDPDLLQYIEDTAYASLTSEFSSDDYIITEVNAIYISNEYLEELEYNSKTNIFFGYSLAELDERFAGARYAFTLADDGTTTVEELKFQEDETYSQIIKNVAIGTGVILICVTVSVVSAGLGAPAVVSTFFAASAKTAIDFAFKGAVFGGISAGIVKGIETNNFSEAVKAAALAGSEGFKWGAITGAASGGAKELVRLRNTIPTPRQSELYALDFYKGKEQISFLGGKEVPSGTLSSTRPDIVRMVGDTLEAIEVKNYDLNIPGNRNNMYQELLRQVTERSQNLPTGSLQRVVLDVRGRKYSKTFLDIIVNNIKNTCSPIYADIPVDLIRW